MAGASAVLALVVFDLKHPFSSLRYNLNVYLLGGGLPPCKATSELVQATYEPFNQVNLIHVHQAFQVDFTNVVVAHRQAASVLSTLSCTLAHAFYQVQGLSACSGCEAFPPDITWSRTCFWT